MLIRHSFKFTEKILAAPGESRAAFAYAFKPRRTYQQPSHDGETWLTDTFQGRGPCDWDIRNRDQHQCRSIGPATTTADPQPQPRPMQCIETATATCKPCDSTITGGPAPRPKPMPQQRDGNGDVASV